ncbi:hypothetical protein C8F04DRAFT_1387775 [Mycena alexandri]|uniref:Uncharacterized protein n=1 Tax=Mycena alexandri TaxID=1745969 RepID=A0AAD6XFC0_9AGAR|nr:hypothetical protein C8F04DRAFT_1387775 [Mycena alexandri]
MHLDFSLEPFAQLRISAAKQKFIETFSGSSESPFSRTLTAEIPRRRPDYSFSSPAVTRSSGTQHSLQDQAYDFSAYQRTFSKRPGRPSGLVLYLEGALEFRALPCVCISYPMPNAERGKLNGRTVFPLPLPKTLERGKTSQMVSIILHTPESLDYTPSPTAAGFVSSCPTVRTGSARVRLPPISLPVDRTLTAALAALRELTLYDDCLDNAAFPLPHVPVIPPPLAPAARMSTPEDIVLSYGESLYRDFVPHDVGYVFYGIYLVVFVIYFWTTIQRPMPSIAARLLFCAMLLLFFSSTAQYIADMLLSLEQMEAYLTWTSVPLADRRTVWLQTHAGLYKTQRWPTAFNFVISDLIVIWRASVIFTLSRWIRVSLWSVGLADVGVWLCAASITSRDAVERTQNRSIDETINTVANCMSLATNLVGTVAIGVKAWNQRKFMKQHTMWGSNVPRVLLLLVETGGIWAMVQLAFSVLQQVNHGGNAKLDLATAVVARIATYFAAILPTATLIIARSQRSVDYVTLERRREQPSTVEYTQIERTLRGG